jgi:hypothetical protein
MVGCVASLAEPSPPSPTQITPGPRELRLLSDTPLDDDAGDVLGFDALAEVLAELVDSERTATPLTLAISAPWGAGKTTMALMVQRRLAQMSAQRNGQRPTLVCWFNAWQHADAPHLGAALAAAVATAMDRRRPTWRRVLNPLPSTLVSPRARVRRRLAYALFALAVAALVMLVPQSHDLVTGAFGVGEDKAARLGPLVVTVLAGLVVWRRVFSTAEAAARFVEAPETAAALGSMATVRAELGALIAQARQGGRLVIFVDDLERCPPERALEVCEVTSQLLAHEGVVAVLVADMAKIAQSAGARYAEHDVADAGRRYLEKLVQIQVTLPPPRPQDLDALLRPPRQEPVPAAAAPDESPPDRRGRTRAITLRLGWKPAVLAFVVFIVTANTEPDDTVTFTGLSVVLLLVAICIGVAAGLMRRIERERTQRRLAAINEAIDEVAQSGPAEDLETTVREKVGQAGSRGQVENVDALVHQQVRSYLIHESEDLKHVEAYIRRFPPDLPRGAKRMLNHARVLTRVAVDRGVLEGHEVTPQHLGKWIVVSERWVDIASYVKKKPAVMRELEDDARTGKLGDTFHDLPAHDLAEVLREEPKLSDVIERLIRFEPGTPTAEPANNGHAAAGLLDGPQAIH